MKKRGEFILLILLFSVALKGQDISVTARFDTSRIYLGDQVNFTVTVNQPSDISLPFPVFRDTIVKNIEILAGPVIDTATLSGKTIKITGKYLVTSFDSGFYRVDPVFVELKNDQGVKRFYSDYSILSVARVRLTPPDTTAKIFDIVKPYSAPVTFAEVLPWILAALVAAALAWFLVRFLKRFRNVKKETEVPVQVDPAHIIAFRELETLKDQKLWQSGETKKYYTRLTEILRTYLENRFGVTSLELTTSETLDALVRTGFKKDDSYNLLKKVLNGADLVKFAKYKPDPDENEISFQDSWNFVSVTRKEEVVPETAGSKDKKEGTSV